eukprot:665076-Amorphochlora_amoeboformis.AAC.1
MLPRRQGLRKSHQSSTATYHKYVLSPNSHCHARVYSPRSRAVILAFFRPAASRQIYFHQRLAHVCAED